MRLSEYQSAAMKTAVFPEEVGQIYTITGLLNETGELAGAFKKFLRGDYGPEELRTRLRGEIGDVLWYLAAICEVNDLSLQNIAEDNLTKLAKRQSEGKLKGDGDKR